MISCCAATADFTQLVKEPLSRHSAPKWLICFWGEWVTVSKSRNTDSARWRRILGRVQFFLLQSLSRSSERVNALRVRIKFSVVTPSTSVPLVQRWLDGPPLKRKRPSKQSSICFGKRYARDLIDITSMKTLEKSTRAHIPWNVTFLTLTLGLCHCKGGLLFPYVLR